MTRSLLLAALVAIGLTACKKEEVATSSPAPSAPTVTPALGVAPKADAGTPAGTGTVGDTAGAPGAATTPMPSSPSESKPDEKK